MRDIIQFFLHRWLRLFGGLMVFVSLGLLVFLILLDLIVGLENPYLGILTYMVLPGVLTFGLILVPLDSFLRRRRIAAGSPEEALSLSIDLTNPKQRKLFTFFSVATVFILIVATVATYKAIEFADTTTFCGLTCHKIMKPEYVAYERSPHASVSCVACHIGPGAPFFVRAKINGMPQVYHYTLKDYPRPIPTPVHALRPSRDTCENCHAPDAFYGRALWTKVSYKPDPGNTMVTQTMVMRVGSGAVKGSGIHSHIVQKIWYVPANEKRTEVAWVKVQRVDGTVGEYVNPDYAPDLRSLEARRETRFMDCIDCHNRAAHDFVDFITLLDSALTKGTIDRTIPYIKRMAVTAVPELDRPSTEAEYEKTVDAIEAIPANYERQHPDVYTNRERDIRRAAAAIKAIHEETAFPHMRIAGGVTYPNWVTHEGCFRCHGKLVKYKGVARETLDKDCLLCHTLPENISGRPLFSSEAPLPQ